MSTIAKTAAISTATTDLTMVRGDTPTFAVVVTRGDTVVDITDATFKFTARRAYGDDAAVFTRTSVAGITITDATAGKCKVVLQSADTTGLPAATTVLVYDLQITEDDGTVSTVAQGKLTVTPDVSV